MSANLLSPRRAIAAAILTLVAHVSCTKIIVPGISDGGAMATTGTDGPMTTGMGEASSTTGNTASTTATTATSTTATTTSSTGGMGGAGGGANTGGHGVVTVVSVPFDVGPVYNLLADFKHPLEVVPSTCTTTTIGACTVVACPDGPPAPKEAVASAGVIDVTGAVNPLEIIPEADGSYTGEAGLLPAPLWSGGETITVTAQGAVVPAFTITATAPSTIDIVTPMPPSGPLLVDRTQDLPFAWTTNGGGTVSISFSVNSGKPGSVVLSCQLLQGSLACVIPKAALQLLPANQGGILDFHPGGEAKKQVGGWSLAVDLVGAATWSGGLGPGEFTAIN